MNVFTGEEPSVSYLQLPVKTERKKVASALDAVKWDMEDALLSSRQHGAIFVPRTHMLHKPARRYEKFVKDNPIASSRRNTPVQEQKTTVNTQEPNQ